MNLHGRSGCHFDLKVLVSQAGNIGIGLVTEKDRNEWDSCSKESIFYILWNGEIFKDGEVSQKCVPIGKGS